MLQAGSRRGRRCRHVASGRRARAVICARLTSGTSVIAGSYGGQQQRKRELRGTAGVEVRRCNELGGTKSALQARLACKQTTRAAAEAVSPARGRRSETILNCRVCGGGGKYGTLQAQVEVEEDFFRIS